MEKKKNKHAVAMGRLGGKAGRGPAKARKVTSEQARKAVQARWEKWRPILAQRRAEEARRWQASQRDHFLFGFAKGAGLDRIKADEAWATYSQHQQLSDQERVRIEDKGIDSGFKMGRDYRRQFPDALRPTF